MDWLLNLFTGNSVAAQIVGISVTASLGLMLGKIKIKGISLGGAGALFVGILLGHLGLRIDGNILHFVQEFGLILFVYTIGMQVGPGFIDSIRRHGFILNVLAVSVILLGVCITLCLFFFTDMRNNVPVLIGMLCGAVTNTPSLGAANSALASFGADTSLTSIGYAVAYPFGVIGIILTMILCRIIFKQNPDTSAINYAKEIAQTRKEICSCSILLQNKNLIGLQIKEIPNLISEGIVVTRLLRDGVVSMPNGKTVLQEGDSIHIVGFKESIQKMEKIIGKTLDSPIIDIKSQIETRSILVTNKKILGKTLGELGLERYGVTVSRIVRGDFKFTGRLDLRIKFADKLLLVGKKENIDCAAEELGNSLKALDHPEILPAFLGIFIGIIVGSVPISIPGMPMPLKLGLAGGPLIVSILLSRKRKIGPLNFFMAASANLMLRELGITLFLTCVGLNAGLRFFDVLLNGDGLYYMGLASLITFIPIFIASILGILVFKVNYLSLCGAIAGSMTDPPALTFANGLSSSEATNVGYASVYPLTMLLRILSAQILAIVLYL